MFRLCSQVQVNIFGGLTLGDMIAKGVLLAYQEVGIKLPVVARIRGTNEEEGQRLIAESGLPIEAYNDFEEAALRVIQLANEGSTKIDREVQK
jgi:succinyl-CoA synthetase alpha subunit